MRISDITSLTWYRLSATLLNIRSVLGRSEPPVAVFQSIVKGVTTFFGSEDETIIFHLRDHRHYKGYREGARIGLEIFFCHHPLDYVEKWRQALSDYLSRPQNSKNFKLLSCHAPELRTYQKLASEWKDFPTEGELCLEFITPLSFPRQKGKPITFLDADRFVGMLASRFTKLFCKSIKYLGAPSGFKPLPYYWHFNNSQTHRSTSQPGTESILGGCLGNLYLKGKFADILPFLILGSELHCGSKKTYAMGHFHLHRKSPGYFQRRFPTSRGLLSSIRSVIERYDSALQSLSATDISPFDDVKFANTLCGSIKSGQYEPAPNIAFTISKKNHSTRMVEQLGFRDLIVQQYLLDELSKPFDRMFEEGSIGFRKGISRQTAIKKIQTQIDAGYQYVIESDIEDFFPSIDLDIMEKILRDCLPAADTAILQLLSKMIRAGYVLNGQYHHRTQGLSQGAPLSPVLANLYLDKFDERMAELGAKMVRYADDFVILTRSRDIAEKLLASSQECLAELKLTINSEKTSIHPIKEGFRFVGMTFSRNEVEVLPEEDFKRYKKPLFITEPFVFLSLNGGAVEIKQFRTILDTIPLRRLSEIIVMEKAVFSTGLIKKCVDMKIPLTLTLNSGYYVTTIKPDSKEYYRITYEHNRQFNLLSETEKLGFAKEFATGKLRNYISLFRQRYTQKTGQFIHELERVITQINQAATVDSIRGHEGSAAKKTYKQLNNLIDNGHFHIRKRERKNPDPINSLLNFGYYMLFTRVNAAVRALGLNPYLGFLHNSEDNYESLVCDIEELFRARIDRFLIRLINLKIITLADFEKRKNGQRLTRNGIKKFLAQFETEMERTNKANPLSLKESIYIQASWVKKYVMEDAPLPFYEWKT